MKYDLIMRKIKHLCFSVRGNDSSCMTCNIKQLGYCELLMNFLNKNYAKFIANKVPTDEQDDILNLCIVAIQKDINTYQGDKNKIFYGWVRQIINNKIVDYYRKNKINQNIAINNYNPFDKFIDIQSIVDIFLEMIDNKKDPGGCCQFYLEYYKMCKQYLNFNQKDMAHHCNKKPNTYNQILSRCRKIIAKLLEEKGFV